jgi:ribosomal protein L28
LVGGRRYSINISAKFLRALDKREIAVYNKKGKGKRSGKADG